MKKYFTVYKITNQINGKIYIGVHVTKDIDDGYMGSGKYLKRAQEKYGIENFTKEILEYCDDKDELNEMEYHYIIQFNSINPRGYNLTYGGDGGWDYINKNILTKEKRKETSKNNGFNKKLFLENKKYRKKFEETWFLLGIQLKERHKNGLIKYNNFKGKKHTKETKQKIGKANSQHQKGFRNSQYGTCWIYNLNLKENKKIFKEDLDKWLDLGWIKGRKMGF